MIPLPKGIMRKKRSDDFAQVIQQRILAGALKQEIAKELGVSNALVSMYSKGIKAKPWRKHGLNENAFSGKMTKEMAYIVGFLLADGCLYKKYDSISIAVQKGDVDALYRMADFFGTSSDAVQLGHNGVCYLFRVVSKTIYEDLQNFGLSERKSSTGASRFNQERLSDFMWPFFLGLIDGDGCYHVRLGSKFAARCSVMLTGNYPVLSQMKEFLESQGFSPTLCQSSSSKIAFNLVLNKRQEIKKLYQLLYDEDTIKFCLKRKQRILEAFAESV